jgi:hypothetical protein
MPDGHVASSQDQRNGPSVNAELICELENRESMPVSLNEIIDLIVSEPAMDLPLGSSIGLDATHRNRIENRFK